MKKIMSIILAMLMILSSVNVFALSSNQEIYVLNEGNEDTYINEKVASLIRQSDGKIDNEDEVHVLFRLKQEYFHEFGQMIDASRLYSEEGIKEQLDFAHMAIAKAVSDFKSRGFVFDVIDEFTVLLLGFDTKVSFRDAKSMASLDFVESATIQKTIMKPAFKGDGPRFRAYSTKQSRDIIGNEAVYSKFKGEGTIVAVIDSGFDVDHEAFYLSEEGKAKAVYDEAAIEKLKNDGILKQGRYFSEKIPFGCNYFPESNPEKLKQRSLNSHGQHVAGSIAANKVRVRYDGVDREFVGVAPEAQLALMRVFSDDNPGTDPSIYVKALEDCVKLKVTAVNMSIGSPAGDATQIDKDTTEALNRLAEAGCVVAVAAGNETAFGMGHELHPYKDNPDYGILGNPAAAEKSFAVASVENGFTVQDYFVHKSASGEQKYALKWSVDTSDDSMTEPIYDTEYDMVYVGLGREEDYNENNYDVSGKLVLIERGENTFENKVDTAIKHGAKAVLIYNHEDGGDQFIGMANTWNKSVPVASLYYSTGMALRNSMGKVIFKKGKVELNNPLAGQISIFSSFGLSSDGSFKPEITAPGGNILSLGNNNTYNVQSGTSMATPHVAGGLALARSMVDERFPNLPLEEKWQRIRNLIMSSAQIHFDGEAATSPRRQGAGIMKLQNALTTKAILLGDKVETKILKRNASNNEVLRFKIQNLSNEELTYNYKALVVADALNGDYYTYKTRKLKDIPCGEIKIAANETKDVSVTIDTRDFASKLKEEMPNGYFIDGFVVFENENEPEISIPFITFVGDLDKLAYIEKPVYELAKEGKVPYYWNDKATVHIAGLNDDEVPNSDFTHLYTYIEEKSEILGQSKDFTNSDPKFYDKRVISPNKDGYADTLSASYTMLRSGHVSAFVYKLDEYGQKQAEPIATLLEDEYMTKNFGSSMMPLSYSLGRTYPDAKTSLEDGDYVLSLKAYSNKDNPADDVDMTFTVDTKKPSIDNASLEENILRFDAKDENGLREVIVKNANEVIEKNTDGSYTIEDGADLNDITVEAIDLGYNKYKTTAKMLLEGNNSSLKVNVNLNKEDPEFKLIYKIYDEGGREFYEDNLAPGSYTLRINKPEEIFEIKKINDINIDSVKFEDGVYLYEFTVEENKVTEVNIDVEKLDAYYVYFWVYGNHKDFHGVKLVNKDNNKEIVFEMTIGEDSPTYFGPKTFEKLVPYGNYKIIFDADMDNYKYDIKREEVNAEGKNEKVDANFDLEVNADSKLNSVGNISYSIDVNKNNMTVNIIGDNLDKSKFKLVEDGTDKNLSSLNTLPAKDVVNSVEVEPKDYLLAALPEEGYYADPPLYYLELGRNSKITNLPSGTKYDVVGDTVDLEMDIHKSEGFGSLKIEDNSEELGYKQEYTVEDLRSYFAMGGNKYTDFNHLPEGNYVVRPKLDENSSHITNDTFKFVTVRANSEALARFTFEAIPEPQFDGFAMITSEDELNIKAKELSSGDVQELQAMPDDEIKGRYIYFLAGNRGIYELIVNDGNDEGYDYPKYVMVIGDSVIEVKKAHKEEPVNPDADKIKEALDELHKLIDEAKAIDEAKYTEDSVNRLKETISQVDKDYDTLAELEGAIDALKQAMSKLEEKPVEPNPNPEPQPEPQPQPEPKPYEPYEPYEPSPRPYRPHRPSEPSKPINNNEDKKDEKLVETKKDYGIITEYPINPVELKDVPAGPEGEAIRNLVSYGVIKGMGNSKFQGNKTITRAMVTRVFMLISKDKVIDKDVYFTDVTNDKWYAESVKWAASKGIIAGYTDGTFKPDKKVTRQEFCVMLNNLLKANGIELETVVPVDEAEFAKADSWAKDAMIAMKRAGLVNVEASGKFGPKSKFTREELAKTIDLLIKLIRLKENK